METLTTDTEQPTPQSLRYPEIAALTIVWSREEPERIGECLLPALDEAQAGPVVFGRGLDSADPRGPHPRISLIRQRPGSNVETPPLASRKVSREQLRITSLSNGLLQLENRGRRDLLVNGREVKRQRQVRDGDIVELRGVLMFLVNRRPKILPGRRLPAALWPEFGEGDAAGIIGESPSIWQLRAEIEFIARHDLHTLITGASGTGKELAARGIHMQSRRSDRPMVARNAATIPSGLVDAELFGNIANYPNPGTIARPGLIGASHESSLFLDEVGELSHELQAHLLRVLDEGEYQRLGESAMRHVDLRLIAATNRAAHELKHDFRARMRMRLEVPGLEARREDIGLLIPALIRKATSDDPATVSAFFPQGDPSAYPRLDPRLICAVLSHDYTTHVRELESILWTGMMHSATAGLNHISLATPLTSSSSDVEPIERNPASLSRERIIAILREVNGVKDHAWPLLGLRNRYQLNRLIKKHSIDVNALD